MNKLITSLLLAAALVVGIACDSDDDEAATPTTEPSATAAASVQPTGPSSSTPTVAPDARLYPAGTRTNDPVIDDVIEALDNRDGDAIAADMRYVDLACGSSITEPPCPDGAGPGTTVEVFPTGNCQPVFQTADKRAEFERNVAADFSGHSYALYAIYSPVSGDRPGDPSVALVFASMSDAAAHTIYLNPAGEVVGLQGTCETPVGDWMFEEDTEFILPPLD